MVNDRNGRAARTTRVVLINMPFADLQYPSFALSQLKTVLCEELGGAVTVEILYLNQEFANVFDLDAYRAISVDLGVQATGIGEWIFRQVAFPDVPGNEDEYFARYWAPPSAGPFRDLIRRERRLAERFCVDAVGRHNLASADVVGFTSMFAQIMPSLGLARVLKDANPRVLTVIGGANCEAPMGLPLLANDTRIDYVFSGPALVTFPRFVQAVASGDMDACEHVAGIVTRNNFREAAARSSSGAERPIDSVVRPDFSEFYAAFNANCLLKGIDPILLFETSRGCWWGEKAHCTFCGLNGSAMAYRPMNPGSALELLEELIRQAYPWCREFQCVDNIMPLDYLDHVFPRLAPPPGVRIFFEVKVRLSPSEMRRLAGAGVTLIQPGIEALATSTLKLMKKGTSAFQNVVFLKNCVRSGISPLWNLLIGFPGEEEDVYEKYARDLPKLVHLPPPVGVFPVRFDRFSPYHMRAEEYGLNLHPSDYYPLTFPFPADSLEDLAYYFSDQTVAPYRIAAGRHRRRLDGLVQAWRAAWADQVPPVLEFDLTSGSRSVRDTRSGSEVVTRLSATAAALLRFAERARRLDALPGLLQVPAAQAAAAVEECRQHRLVFEENARVLSLVLSAAGDADDPGELQQQPGALARDAVLLPIVQSRRPAGTGR